MFGFAVAVCFAKKKRSKKPIFWFSLFNFLLLKYSLILVLKLDILYCENGTATTWYIKVHVFISILVFIFFNPLPCISVILVELH